MVWPLPGNDRRIGTSLIGKRLWHPPKASDTICICGQESEKRVENRVSAGSASATPKENSIWGDAPRKLAFEEGTTLAALLSDTH